MTILAEGRARPGFKVITVVRLLVLRSWSYRQKRTKQNVNNKQKFDKTIYIQCWADGFNVIESSYIYVANIIFVNILLIYSVMFVFMNFASLRNTKIINKSDKWKISVKMDCKNYYKEQINKSSNHYLN